MKKYIITMLVVATVALAGCSVGMSPQQMEQMDAMKAHINDLQEQVDANTETAIRAQDMANEALMKASQKGSSKDRMHRDKMMK